PLPYDEVWVQPPSTLPLAWGSTQTSYETAPRSDHRGTGMGPMSSLLADPKGGRSDPIRLHLSPSCTMDASRTVLVDHSTRSQGGVSVTMEDAREDGAVTQRPLMSSSACRVSHAVSPSPFDPGRSPLTHNGPAGTLTRASVAESPQVIERIIARYSRMRTDVQADDGGAEGAEAEEVVEGECTDDEDESEEDDDVLLKEVTPKTTKKKTTKSRGKSKARDGGGDGDGAVGGGRNSKNWDSDDSLLLVCCKRDLDDHMASQGSNFARMKTKTQKWNEIARRMAQQGLTDKDGESCMKRWENIFGWYRKIWDREKDSGLYDAIHATTPNNQAIHPPNLCDTSGLPPLQADESEQSQARGATIGGETSAGDNMERESADGYGSRSSGGTAAGKRKNARQLAFDSVTDVMKTHSTVVADFVDRASKRQCDVLQRQCDIMEREARTQEKQCDMLDVVRAARGGWDGFVKCGVRDSVEERALTSLGGLEDRGGGGGGGLFGGGFADCEMEVEVALRGRVLSRCIIFYETRHHRGKDYGKDFGFEDGVTRQGVRHYEVDADGDTCLHIIVGYRYGRELLKQVVVFARKVGTAIPDRWVGGSDVLADIIDLLVSNVAMGCAGRLDELATYIVHAEPPFADRSYLHGEVQIVLADIC
ncbi:hypothetical protein CBR_g19935, partial [Chara braunii]